MAVLFATVGVLLELIGAACLAVAGFLVHPALGLVVIGVALILFANFGGFLPSSTERPTGAERETR